MLQIFAKKIMDAIKKDIGDAKFCIIIDEARDEQKKDTNDDYFKIC